MNPLLPLFLSPIVGAVTLLFIPANRLESLRFVALLATTVSFIAAWVAAYGFDVDSPEMQFVISYAWNTQMGTSFSLGVDGLSLSMVLLTVVLFLVALLVSTSISHRQRSYYVLVLLLQSSTLGVFLARDWSLFYVFWELTLIPLFLLINRWGGVNRSSASLNFVLYTLGGSVFMLIALLLLFDKTPEHSFSMLAMAAGAAELSADTQLLIFLGFLVGFGVKMPIFPLHGWLPLAHVEAPGPISILLSGILLKMGSYGLIRAADALPRAVTQLQEELAAVAVINLIYGGLLAWRQLDLKSMIAYSSMSHMGIVLLGIATLNMSGLTGAVYQMVSHGLVAGALFLIIGLLYERTGTRNIVDYSSLVKATPKFAFFTILTLIAAIGLPGTAGFIAEIHVLVGGFQQWGWWILVISIGVMISAAYSVRTISYLFTGPIRANMDSVPDLKGAELLALAVLAAAMILLGIFPAPLLQMIEQGIIGLSVLFGKI